MKSNSVSKKMNRFRTSPFMVGIAIVEVIILICVSTYAWFAITERDSITAEFIGVEPNSGLEIDFNDASEDGAVNINRYITDFCFEPVTSLDGRNIFIPTTGTFSAYAGDVSPDTPSSPENPGDTQNTYLIYFDTKGTGWSNTPYIECDYTYAEHDNIAMTRLNSTSTIYYYDLAPLMNKYYPAKLTFMKFKNGKGGNGTANITNMFGTTYNCIYSTLLANYLYKCKLDSDDQAIEGKQAEHYGLMVLEPEPYSGTVPDIGGGGTGNSGSGESSGAVADKGGIKFREATVNDMNSKYINVDFTLTNTSQDEMPVYLSSKSTFTYDLGDGETSEGKALRIAFYQNDGNSGAVDNDLLDKDDSSTPGGTGNDSFYIFFKNNATKNKWNNILSENDHTKNKYNGGAPMDKVYNSKGEEFYCIEVSEYLNANQNLTFLKFTTDDANVHPNQTQQFGVYQGENADELTERYIKFNDYYYEFDLNTDGSPKIDSSDQHYLLKDPIKFNPGDKPNVSSDTTASSTETTTVYFQNTRNWETPYIHVWNPNDNDATPNDIAYPGVKMTKIAGNLYYHTFESKYTNVVFSEGKSSTTPNREQSVDVEGAKNGYIYYLTDLNNSNNSVYSYNYGCYLYESSDDGDGYPVISPGVSAGFQRAYAPVLSIDNASGKSTNIVPAFASSIDNYTYASSNPLFTIKNGETKTMSMIIWLEGTDEDCTGDNYLGKNIDLNLIFATKDNADELYTYKFIDATKETWLAHKAANGSGILFDPVIQLYDYDTQKGYMMKLGNDGKTWSCKAPKELEKSKHIAFRRVNPLDETMVWNFWDTYGFNGYTSAVSEVIDEKNVEVIYFTAFSDGAPNWDSVKTNPKQTSIKNEKLPERSCGGLWGKYETGTMYVFDGTPTRWLKGKDTDDTIDGTTGVLTINYKLNNQRIEYKASADDSKGLYYFIVPLEVCDTSNSNRPEVLIKRYYNFFEGLAMNDINRNGEICFHKMWSNTKSGGWLYQINDAGNENDSYGNGYWGNDMLYIEANMNNDFNILADSAKMQVKFFKDSYESSTNFYSYIYENSAFKGNGGAYYGFACVIPSQGDYNRYTVERCHQNGTVWNRTHSVSNSISYSGNSSPYNVTAYNNICKLTGYQSDNNFYIVNECYNNADAKP